MRIAGEQGGSPDCGYKPRILVKSCHRHDHTATMRSLVFVLLIGAALWLTISDAKESHEQVLDIGDYICKESAQMTRPQGIMLGEHNVRVFEGTEQLMKTDTIIWHPDYDYQTLDYDIMLIKLFHPVEVTEAVAPIPLAKGCPMGGLSCSVSGWGNSAMGGEGGFLIVIKRY
ncbi:hypothetical protein F2P81_002107 [Scophthalmus maximus]|uniref:trypsin n=1 Tax=Scophthalmus maximus TaxID=52904 RepID=A0A6A4TME4_SCOMX|nr:hypothetical protein F2P81_002107 [Scophthalmus maximus]